MNWRWFVLALLPFCMSAAAGEIVYQKDLVYATVMSGSGKAVELRYDMARPTGEGPYPLVVCIHAGGWQIGDKKSYRGIIQDLARRGYVAVTINYRLTPDDPWPAQIDDVRRAVRYFRAHAAQFHIDPKYVGAIGDDAGGHLSLMLGLLSAKDEQGQPVEASSRIQVVGTYFGPTDLREWRVNSTWLEAKIRVAFFRSSEQIIEDLLGTRDRTAKIFADVSPISHVTADAPPVITVIGSADPLVSVRQPRAFHAALEKAGVEEELLVVEGAEHSLASVNGKTGEADDKVFAFLDKHLRAAVAGHEACARRVGNE